MQNILETLFGVFPEFQGVIYLGSAQKQNYSEKLALLLHLVKSLVKFEWRTTPPALFLVTEMAQAAGVQKLNFCTPVFQAPLWGLGRVIMNELPDFHTRMIDIGSSEDIHSLFKEITANTNEDEIAIRGESRYVHRLIKSSPERFQADHNKPQIISVKNQICLEIADPEILSEPLSLQLRKDRNNRIEIQVDGNSGIRISAQDDKILLKPVSQEIIHDDATYLITGGLSGFGLAAAKWLGKQGAKHLVLIGRSGISNTEAEKAVEEMNQAGIHIKIAKADVTNSEQIANLFDEIDKTMPGLKGIIHSANVYDDAFLTDLTVERMNKVINPKVIGAWNLHQQTLNMPLDFFVMFSSVTSVIGNPGQGNYAAANAFS